MCTGRGWGKTLVGANWLGLEAAQHPNSYNAVVAPTHNDARYVCFEGPTGLLSVIPPVLFKSEDYSRSVPELKLWNGAVIRGFAGDSPDRLRGPQHHRAWAEEIAAWQNPEEAWSNMIFGLRLGKRPRLLWTTTPRPTAFMRARMLQPGAVITTGSIHENEENLPQNLLDEIEQYRGTRIWEQEALGKLIDPEEGGAVRRSQWKLWPANRPLPALEVIVLSLDTALSEENVDLRRNRSDYTACTVWGAYREALSAEEKEKIAAKQKDELRTAAALRAGTPRILLLDAWEERLGFPDLVSRVKKAQEAHYGLDEQKPLIRPLVGSARRQDQGRKADIVLIEDKASGISLRQTLRREGIPVVAYNPGHADKLLRLNLTAPLFASGYVYAAESRHRPTQFMKWAEPVVTQICSYSGKNSLEHEDLMDSATQALLWLARNWLNRAPGSMHNNVRKLRTPEGVNPYAA